MKQEDTIRMAEEAGWNDGGDYINIEQFAALVAAAENEACAKLLEESSGTGKLVSCMSAASAIRARGQA